MRYCAFKQGSMECKLYSERGRIKRGTVFARGSRVLRLGGADSVLPPGIARELVANQERAR